MLGYYSLNNSRPSVMLTVANTKNSALMQGLYTDPNKRRDGFGLKIIKSALEHASDAGAEQAKAHALLVTRGQ